MRIDATPLPGCFEIIPEIFMDERGSFVKTFSKDIYTKAGLQHDDARFDGL